MSPIACLCNTEIIRRYVTYALLARRTSTFATSSTTYAVINCGRYGLLDECSIAGAGEVYRSLGLPTAPHVTVLTYIRGLQLQ